MTDFRQGSLRSVLVLSVSILLVTASLAQGKPYWPRTELQQIVDLQSSVILIPLLDEPQISSISIGRDPELMRVREVNEAIIAGAQNHFLVADYLFFYMEDSASVYQGDFSDRLFNMHKELVETDKSISDLFVVEYLPPNLMAKREVVVYNQRRIRKQQRKGQKHQDIVNELERQILLESDSVRVAKKRKKSMWHQAKILDIMAPTFAFPQHDQLNSYWTEKEYFHAESVDHRRLVIRRFQGKGIKASKNVSYKVNWNFVARLHTTVDEKTKYAEAFGYLNRKLQERKAELSKNLNLELN